MSAKGFNFKEFAREHPQEARKLGEMAERRSQIAQTRSMTHDTPGAADLSEVPFPERSNPALKDFGFKHHSDVSKLSYHIGGWLALPETVLTAVKGAGMLHDLGRTTPWAPGASREPGHHERSAKLADEVMRRDPIFWGAREMREEVCWLVSNHKMDGPAPTDKRLIALWDAECFEQARFAVGTREGAESMKAGFAKCITAWAQLHEHQTTWRGEKGWK